MKGEKIYIRLSDGEKDAWAEKARAVGLSLSEWIRKRCGDGLPSEGGATAGGVGRKKVRGVERISVPPVQGEVLRDSGGEDRPDIRPEAARDVGEVLDGPGSSLRQGLGKPAPKKKMKLCPRCARINAPVCPECKKRNVN